jgi:uncharacterized protein YndB with AHSA1/START domain
MTVLRNEITINAPIEEIWEALSNVEELEKYDPTVQTSVALTASKSGINARRKVNMRDGKNWFEEVITEWEPGKLLTYQLIACSFPVRELKHTYSFEKIGHQTIVKQIMEYRVKYGLIGKILDILMIRRESDGGVKKFLRGLKLHVEE